MANKASAGDILHFGAVRLRATGSGNLHISVNSLQTVHMDNLADQALLTATNIEPVTLANYIDQRGQIRVGTSSINEVFNISRMVIFIKVVASEYPQ